MMTVCRCAPSRLGKRTGPPDPRSLSFSRNSFWSAGVKYETGPWSFGLDYITENEQQPNFPFGDQNGRGFEGAIGYTFNEWLRVTGGYQRFEFDGPVGQCQTDHGGGTIFPPCDTQDANVGFVETKFSF